MLISIGDLFKKSFEFYKSKFYIIITLALIPFVNFAITSVLMGSFEVKKDGIGFYVGLVLIVLIFSLVALVVNFWVELAFFYAIKEKDAKTDAKSLLKFSWPNIYSYAWIAFLMGIIMMAGFLLLIIPGIIFSIWFSLSLYVFVFEEVKGMKALKRSKELVYGYWWPVFGRLFVFGLCAAVLGVLPLIGFLLNIFLAMPMGIIYGYFLYEDLKKIKTAPIVSI